MPQESYVELPRLPEAFRHVNLSFDALHDDAAGLVIRLGIGPNRPNSFEIRFANPLAYPNADEGKRLQTLATTHVVCGIYEILDSTLAEWLHEESGYTRDMNIRAFAVVTTDDWIEVLDTQEPQIVPL